MLSGTTVYKVIVLHFTDWVFLLAFPPIELSALWKAAWCFVYRFQFLGNIIITLPTMCSNRVMGIGKLGPLCSEAWDREWKTPCIREKSFSRVGISCWGPQCVTFWFAQEAVLLVILGISSYWWQCKNTISLKRLLWDSPNSHIAKNRWPGDIR